MSFIHKWKIMLSKFKNCKYWFLFSETNEVINGVNSIIINKVQPYMMWLCNVLQYCTYISNKFKFIFVQVFVLTIFWGETSSLI